MLNDKFVLYLPKIYKSINTMETNQETNEQGSPKNSKLKTVFLVLLLLLPLAFLLIKFMGSSDSAKEQATATQPQQVDIAALENAANTNPTFDNLINLSLAYINNQAPGKSIGYLKKAIELNPKSPIAYNNLGVAYIMLKDYSKGIEACSAALQIDSTFQLAKNNLKWGMDEKNKLIAIIQEQEKVPNDKRDISFYVSYGMNYFTINEYDKSIEIWNNILKMDAKNTIALNNIGTALTLKKDYDNAISTFKKVLELEATNQLAKNNLAWAMDEKNKATASVKK